MKKYFIFLMLFLSSGVNATTWVDGFASSTEHKETTYIDYESIAGYYFNSHNKDKYYVVAWVKKEYPVAQKLTNGKSYKVEKSFWYVDCKNAKFSMGDGVLYTSTGRVVDSFKGYVQTYLSDNWQRAVPDSVGYTIAHGICTYYNIKTTPSPAQSK